VRLSFVFRSSFVRRSFVVRSSSFVRSFVRRRSFVVRSSLFVVRSSSFGIVVVLAVSLSVAVSKVFFSVVCGAVRCWFVCVSNVALPCCCGVENVVVLLLFFRCDAVRAVCGRVSSSFATCDITCG